MCLLTKILVTMVIIECLFIFFIETIIPKSKITSQIFKIPKDELNNQYINVLIKNQGIYNLLLAPILFIGIFSNNLLLTSIILIYIILVAIYGSLTSQKKIILTQGGLPLLALISILMS